MKAVRSERAGRQGGRGERTHERDLEVGPEAALGPGQVGPGQVRVLGVGRHAEDLGVERAERRQGAVEREDLGRADWWAGAGPGGEGQRARGFGRRKRADRDEPKVNWRRRAGQSGSTGESAAESEGSTHVHGVEQRDQPLALVRVEADLLRATEQRQKRPSVPRPKPSMDRRARETHLEGALGDGGALEEGSGLSGCEAGSRGGARRVRGSQKASSRTRRQEPAVSDRLEQLVQPGRAQVRQHARAGRRPASRPGSRTGRQRRPGGRASWRTRRGGRARRRAAGGRAGPGRPRTWRRPNGGQVRTSGTCWGLGWVWRKGRVRVGVGEQVASSVASRASDDGGRPAWEPSRALG